VEERDRIYVAADGGDLFVGDGKRWKQIATPSRESFWSIEIFEGEVYVAGDDGVFMINRAKAERIGRVSRTASPYHLCAGDGVLWSFGLYQLHAFDGRAWRPMPAPVDQRAIKR
jgi:hypothetical protein